MIIKTIADGYIENAVNIMVFLVWCGAQLVVLDLLLEEHFQNM